MLHDSSDSVACIQTEQYMILQNNKLTNECIDETSLCIARKKKSWILSIILIVLLCTHHFWIVDFVCWNVVSYFSQFIRRQSIFRGRISNIINSNWSIRFIPLETRPRYACKKNWRKANLKWCRWFFVLHSTTKKRMCFDGNYIILPEIWNTFGFVKN